MFILVRCHGLTVAENGSVDTLELVVTSAWQALLCECLSQLWVEDQLFSYLLDVPVVISEEEGN